MLRILKPLMETFQNVIKNKNPGERHLLGKVRGMLYDNITLVKGRLNEISES